MDTFSGPALVTDLLQAVLGHLQGSAVRVADAA